MGLYGAGIGVCSIGVRGAGRRGQACRTQRESVSTTAPPVNVKEHLLSIRSVGKSASRSRTLSNSVSF